MISIPPAFLLFTDPIGLLFTPGALDEEEEEEVGSMGVMDTEGLMSVPKPDEEVEEGSFFSD